MTALRVARGFAAGILAALMLALVVATPLPATGAGAQAGAGINPSPLFWKIEHGQSTLYLLGTFHLLKQDTRWLTPGITAALDSADQLLLEISEAEVDVGLVASIVRNKGMYAGAPGLQAALDSKTWQALVEQAAAIGIPEQMIGRFRPWYVSILLSIQYAQAEGFLAEYGAEAILTARAVAAGQPVLGLETADEQLSALADHPERIQVMMLEDTLQELEELPRILGDMTAAWVSGDEDAINALIVSGMLEIPELYDALIVRRNLNWIPLLEAHLKKPGVTFLAVGVGHLVGADSVIALLRDQGYKVESVK